MEVGFTQTAGTDRVFTCPVVTLQQEQTSYYY